MPGNTERQTLAALLLESAARDPERALVIEGGRTLTNAVLVDEVSRSAAGLAALDINAGDALLVALHDIEDALALFWGALLRGAVPALVAAPRDAGASERARIEAARAAIHARVVVVDRGVASLAREGIAPDVRVIDAAEVRSRDARALHSLPGRAQGDVAFFQLSSGSTRAPQPIAIRHENVLANIAQLARRLPISRDDVKLSWMPLFHDMGLIGAHLLPMHVGMREVRMDALLAMGNPLRWLQAASAHKATVLSSTCLGLARAARAMRTASASAAFDLSRIRMVASGAEPLVPDVLREFSRATGVPEAAHFPMYGLAEATVGVACAATTGLRTTRVAGRERVIIGPLLDDMTARVDDDGELLLRGPNVVTSDASDGWLHTGDLVAFTDDEDRSLVVVGRKKELVILGGRNIHPADVEAAVEAVPGVRGGGAVVVADARGDASERPFVIVTIQDDADAWRVLPRVRDVVAAETGVDATAVGVVAVERIPRTTSGKKRRRVVREAVERGAYDDVAHASTRAVVRAAWNDALNRAAPLSEGDDDTSFRDLGGTSIQATRVLALLEERAGIAPDHRLLLAGPTIRRLARVMEQAGGTATANTLARRDSSQAPIAVVSMALRVPRAHGPRSWFDLVARSENHVGRALDSDVIERFDHTRFRVDDDEARVMDPQQRLMLTVAGEALERAHWARGSEPQRVGVFVGACHASHLEKLLPHVHGDGDPDVARLPPGTLAGSLVGMIATRVAHTFDLRGPALAVDTACSSSLVALHLACQSIRAGDCDAALVGGVQLALTSTLTTLFARAGALSPTGTCKPFDAAADGTVPGDGCFALALARLDEAEAQGWPVLGIVRGSAVNNDGTSLSVMAPNPAGQESVIRAALTSSGVEASKVGVVEAHGTATVVGDSVERTVLRRVYGEPRVTASKGVVGHLMGAAGLAGLTSLLGTLKTGELGAVSSFGFGGTNAHVIVEGAWQRVRDDDLRDGATTGAHFSIDDLDAPLRRGAFVVVTGASGALGHALVRALAPFAPRAALVGTRADDEHTKALCRLIVDAGGKATWCSADLTTSSGGHAVARAAQAMGGQDRRVDVLFHLAGTADPKRAHDVKLGGLLRLERLDARVTVLASSISASTPGLDRGLEEYAAANRALDDYARTNANAVAVALPALRAPNGGGLAGPHLRFLEERGVHVVDVDEGARMLMRAVSDASTKEARAVPGGHGGPPLPPETERRAHGGPPRRAHGGPPLPRGSTDVRALLRSFVAAALVKDESALDDDATFPSLGLDSLAAIDIVRRLEEHVGRELSSTLLYEHDTITKAARALGGESAPAPTTPTSTREAPQRVDAPALLPSQLSFVAQRALFPDMPGNVFLAVTLDDERALDETELRDALAVLAGRHESLSTAIARSASGSFISTRGAPPSLTMLTPGALDAAREDALADEPFDLERGPLFRVVTDGRRLILNGHHAAVDAWSVRNVLLELLELVAAKRSNRAADIAPLASTITEVTHRLTQQKGSAADVEWFRAQLVDAPPLHLRWRAPVDAPSSGGAGVALADLDEQATNTAKDLAAEAGVTLPAWVLAAWMRALFDASGQHDLVVRVAQGKRTARVPDIERHVGAFADALPVRATANVDESTATVARRVQAFLSEAQMRSDVSAFDLADVLPRGNAGPVGITPVGFSFPMLPSSDVVSGFVVRDVVGRAGAGFSRATLVAYVTGGRLRLALNYARSHLTAEDAASLVHDVAAHAVDRGNDVVIRPRTLHGRILKQCAATPERIAVHGHDAPLTYRALAQRSGAVASALIDVAAKTRTSAGAGPVGALRDERVAVLAAPSADAAVALLGVMRTGAAYVPLDPHWPDGRADDVLTIAKVRALVAPAALESRARALAATHGVPVVVVDNTISLDHHHAPCEDAASHAYVMFTSGSTGKPKGVLVSHASCLTFQEWVRRAFGVTERDRFAWTSSIAFGGSVRQVFSAFLAGASTHPVTHDEQRDPDALVRLIHDERITIWNSVPSLWLHLMDAAERSPVAAPFAAVRAVLIGGEPVPAAQARRWLQLVERGGHATTCRLFNLYGSVETIVNATWMQVVSAPGAEELHCPIGWPRAGCTVRLDDGEIVVGGAIADAYFGDEALTAQRFVGSPAAYRTGDLATRREDGCFVHRGRIDDQVQVRGNRVELVEIEAALAAHPNVRRALVAWEGERLLAGVELRTPDVTGDITRSLSLRAFVEQKLPAFMVPSRIAVLDALPKTPAGKGDRKALALHFDNHRSVDFVASGLRAHVAAAWREVLSLDAEPRDDDDFFALGGDSIRALQVLDLVRPHVTGEVRPMQLYRHRRFGDLVVALEKLAPAPTLMPVRTAGANEARTALTSVQRGFWLAHKATGRAPTWTAAVPLDGALHLDELSRAMARAAERHPALRAVFVERAPGVVEQRRGEAPVPAIVVVDVAHLDAAAQRAGIDALIEDAAATPFSLEQGPLFALRVVRVSETRHVLVLASHHIISDAWSFFVLLDEVLGELDGRAAPVAPSVDLHDVARSEPTRASADDDAYWRRALATLPATPHRTSTDRARTTTLSLPSDVLEAVSDEARVHGTTPFAVVLAASARALAKGADHVVISVAISGRGSAQDARACARVVGPLARALPIALHAPFTVDRARTALDEALAHADAPPGAILAAAGGDAASLSRFFLSWLDPSAVHASTSSATRASRRVDWSGARFAFAADSTNTDVMIGAMPTREGLALHLHGGDVVDEAAAALARELRALTEPRAALVVYAPPAKKVPIEEAVVIERVRSRLGLSELVLLPCNAAELAQRTDLEAQVARAVSTTGASAVALAGMLPSLLGLGLHDTHDDDARITTGHAATVAAMFLTVRRVLRELGREWRHARVASVGFGSIGRATFELCRAELGEPARFVVVDPAVPAGSASVDGCDLVIAASSGGASIDVDALAPGTAVVDDSFPRAFSDERAWARMRTRRDVLLVGGGMLDAGVLVRRSPFAEADVVRRGLPVRWLPGCHAEACVLAVKPSLGVTRGLVDVARAQAMLRVLDELGICEAPLHLGADEIPREVIANLARSL